MGRPQQRNISPQKGRPPSFRTPNNQNYNRKGDYRQNQDEGYNYTPRTTYHGRRVIIGDHHLGFHPGPIIPIMRGTNIFKTPIEGIMSDLNYCIPTYNRLSPLREENQYSNSYPYMERDHDQYDQFPYNYIQNNPGPQRIGVLPGKIKIKNEALNKQRHPRGDENQKEKEGELSWLRDFQS